MGRFLGWRNCIHSKNGTVKAKKKGKCTIYVYAQDGTYAKVKITVR